MAPQDLKEFLQRLPELHQFLQSQRMDCSVDTWVRIHDLLLVLARQGHLPNNPADLVTIIGPIVCHTPEQQQSFPALFEEWWTQQPQEQMARLSGASLKAQQRQAKATKKVDQTWGRLPYILMLLLAMLLMAGLWWVINYEPHVESSQIPTQKEQQPQQDGTSSSTNKIPTITIDKWAPPQRVGEWPVLPPSWTPRLQFLQQWLPWLPVIPALAWLFYYYHRRWKLSRAKAQGDEDKFSLGIRLLQPLFGNAQTLTQLRRLNTTQWEPTRRLDVQATVEATARQSGLFMPRYLNRSRYPRYLVLVRSRNRRDQSAAMAEELVQRIREQKIEIESFRFRDDPLHLTPWFQTVESNIEEEIVSLTELAEKWQDAGLIIVSEGDILCHPVTALPRPWLAKLDSWEQSVWLHPGSMPETQSNCLRERNVLPLPLTSTNLESLVQWFNQAAHMNSIESDQQQTEPQLPWPLTQMPERWLASTPPYEEDLESLYKQLQDYLGEQGWLLLQAIAVYPEPHWALTQALDFCLFKQHNSQQREQRFSLLGRLPWIRLGYLPDYLRKNLLKKLSRFHQEQLRNAYSRLLIPDKQKDGAGQLQLKIAVPSRRRIRRALLDSLWRKPAPTGLNDPIFLNLVMGGRLSLLDFHLPRFLSRVLPGARWLINPWPALLILLLILGAGWGVNNAWVRWGELGITQARAQYLHWQNKDIKVRIFATTETELLQLSLQQTLISAGYQVTFDKSEEQSNTNSLRYTESMTNEAKQLAAHFGHATYGAKLNLQPISSLPDNQIELHLNKTYQAGSTFQDRLLNSVGKVQLVKPDSEQDQQATQQIMQLATKQQLKPYTVFADVLANKVPTPEMIVIPAGTFQMGSADDETDRDSDEGPQHTVTIRQTFAIGRYEVTFAEYQAYVESTQNKNNNTAPACNSPVMPDDQGWGKGMRPVINVSYIQAQCYIDWLTEQTGHVYRLPTEAEWEYAARGSSAQSYFWGDSADAMQNYAWFFKNSKNQTHPVGKKRPNAFGLYDTAGNVYEWTQDCWHDNYTDAPGDGSAWLDANKGDCDRRVVRGGSWGSVPRGLRSANRDRDDAGEAYNFLGFRVARAL